MATVEPILKKRGRAYAVVHLKDVGRLGLLEPDHWDLNRALALHTESHFFSTLCFEKADVHPKELPNPPAGADTNYISAKGNSSSDFSHAGHFDC